MTGPNLLRKLLQARAFDHFPTNTNLSDLHVPFDALTGTSNYEAPLAASLRRGQRAAVIGPSGAGKSSIINYVLNPLALGIQPIPVPIYNDSDVATDVTAFVKHLTATLRELAEEAAPSRARRLPGRPRGQRTVSKTLTGGFDVKILNLQVARDVQEVAKEQPQSRAAVLTQAQEILDIFREQRLVPVIVLDDTDRWIQDPAHPAADHRAETFFRDVLRTIPDSLDCGLVVAVHNSYISSRGWTAARTVMTDLIELPKLPNPAALGSILLARAQATLQPPPATVDQIIDLAALDRLFSRYETDTPPSILRSALTTAHRALVLADAAGAITIRVQDIDNART